MTDTPELPRDPDETHVATGDRRGEVHYEPKADRVAAVRFTEKPAAAALDPQVLGAVDPPAPHDPPIEDVADVTSRESVWDARPIDEGR